MKNHCAYCFNPIFVEPLCEFHFFASQEARLRRIEAQHEAKAWAAIEAEQRQAEFEAQANAAANA